MSDKPSPGILQAGNAGSMFQWFKYAGYDADIEACCEAYPNMQGYRTWLKVSSGFAKKE